MSSPKNKPQKKHENEKRYKCQKCGEPTNILYNGICEICYDEENELETE